ncbi:TIR-NBS-LRR RCT1 resistance protein, partial [Trifolium medium]|nr:TIR-NBS-LRR RCT1 resistance protein [Trifolium medium]
DDNNVSVSDGDNEALNCFGEGTLNHMQITRHADVVGPIQLIPHYLAQTVEVVAEEIPAAEAQRDLEHQVPPPEGEPEHKPTVAPEDWQTITSNLEPDNNVEVRVVLGEFIVDKTTVSLLYDETVDKEIERCHVIDEEDVIVSGNDVNNVSVSDGDNEALNCFGEGTLKHMQITSHADGLYADVVGLIQPVPHYLDQPAEVVAEEIPAAEEQLDLEHQVPPPEREPEQQPTVAPEAIEPTLGAQIL